MEYVRLIKESETATNIANLWLDVLKLKKWTAKGWISLTGHILGSDNKGIVINPDAGNESYGLESMSTGSHTITYNPAESSFGRWNVSNNTVLPETSTLHSVGMGVEGNRFNAFEIMQNGDAYLKGVGNYDGTNPALAQTLQQVILGTTGGGVIDTAGTFDASPIKGATTITEEFKTELLEAVKLHKLTYITYTDAESGMSYQAAVVYAGFDKDSIKLTTYNNESTDIFTINLADNTVKEESCNYTFYISKDPTLLQLNKLLAADILFQRVESVRIKGTIDKVAYNTMGVYNDGYITALQKGKQVLFNVSFQTGEVTELYSTDVGKSLPYIILDKGTEESIKSSNLEKLTGIEGAFFLCLEYGYGVGDFHAATGGFAHVTTARGNEVFYKLHPDGMIEQMDDYIKPNEPYTLRLTSEDLNGRPIENIPVSAFKNAGELVVITSSGPVTYTRTIDSTDRMFYFTDDDKDGEITRLTYNVSNKTLTPVIVPAPIKAASSYNIGGILKGNKVEQASQTGWDAVSKFNQLLTELERIGVLG